VAQPIDCNGYARYKKLDGGITVRACRAVAGSRAEQFVLLRLARRRG